MKNNSKIIIGISVFILLAIVIILIALSCFTVGRYNQNSILVDSHYGDCEIDIPVKMRNGLYTPTHNAFGSDLSLTQLADKVKTHIYKGTSYEVELYGDRALIKAIKDNEVKGFAILIDRGKYYDKDHRYLLTNCYEMFNNGEDKIRGMLIPWHLVNRSIAIDGKVQNEIELDSGVDIQNIIDFYSIGDHYTVTESENVITVDTNGLEEYSSFEMVFDPTTETLRYIFKE